MSNRVVACRQAYASEGAVHVMCNDNKPACGPWWDGREPDTIWFEVDEKVSCRVCLRILGDMPRRRKVTLSTPSVKTGKVPLVHLAADGSNMRPRCGARCVVTRNYVRVPGDALVTCSRCLGVDLPSGGRR